MKNISYITFVLIIIITGCRNKYALKEGYRYCSDCDGYGYKGILKNKLCTSCLGKGQEIDWSSRLRISPETIYETNHSASSTNQGNDVVNMNENSNITNNIYYEQPTTSAAPQSVNTERVPCRACHQTGQCSCARDGHPGQMLSHYTSSGEPIYIRCSACLGSGSCSGCGGDGLLDYGVDY